MSKRKTIAVIINCPENIYQSRVLKGLYDRCELYDYNLAIFSPMVNSVHFYKDYLHGECNIYELINFDSFDGVVVVSLPFTGMGDYAVFHKIENILKSRCNKPVVCLDMPMCDYHTIYTDDRSAFATITRHVVEQHKCEKIYFLAGSQTEGVEDYRLSGFLDAMKQYGREVPEESIIIGDFWYTSGQQLAERIISGELEKPDAVICESDYMAIGLVNELVQGGVSVPEDIIVTGFDASQDALINTHSVTSYAPANNIMAMEAVDYLRGIIDPGAEILPIDETDDSDLIIGISCGCPINYKNILNCLSASLYRPKRDFGDITVGNNEDLSFLMESYMLEALTESKNPEECLFNIASQVYLIHPLDHFYLCLRPNWLDTEHQQKDGYTEKMRCTIHAGSPELTSISMEGFFYSDTDRVLFDTAEMLPALHEEQDKPTAFYFLPVHFQQNTLGYAVIQSEICKRMKITGVLHNWLRNVNNALELARVSHHLVGDSESDKMTGLKNRLGMDNALKEMLRKANRDDFCYAIVVDLDGLKHINDNYGHTEGDYAITSIANAVAKVTEDWEVAVRAGGDEFYLLGISSNATEKTLVDKVSRYRSAVDEINRVSGKPYQIGASVGFCVRRLSETESVQDIIREADRHMYLCKAENKKQRRN